MLYLSYGRYDYNNEVNNDWPFVVRVRWPAIEERRAFVSSQIRNLSTFQSPCPENDKFYSVGDKIYS